MAKYELVREIRNQCPNNQMRDVFFDEVETDDPIEYVRTFLKGKVAMVPCESEDGQTFTVYAVCDGLEQKFIFTLIA